MSNRILRDDDGVYCLEILDVCSRSFWRFYASLSLFSHQQNRDNAVDSTGENAVDSTRDNEILNSVFFYKVFVLKGFFTNRIVLHSWKRF